MIKIKTWSKLISRYAIMIALAFVIIFFASLEPAFTSFENLINILRQISIIGICSVGMTIVILTAGIDLSVGSIIGVSSVFTATLLVNSIHPFFAVLLALLLGILLGLFNAFFINEIGLPPLIVTLATMTTLRGIAFTITGGMPIYSFSKYAPSFSLIGQGYVFNIIPIPVLIMVFVFIIGFVILNKTVFGRYVYAIGGNKEAVHLAGVSVKKNLYIVYGLAGFLAALAGIVLLSRINSGQPRAGMGYEMDIITGVVLGGVSIFGGVGRITGVIAGVILMGVLSNGMILINIDDYTQWIVKGLVLLGAVSFDKITEKNAR